MPTYPIIDNEFDTRLFDKQLVDHLRHTLSHPPHIPELDGDKQPEPIDWDSLTELEQIEFQLDHFNYAEPVHESDRLTTDEYEARLTRAALHFQSLIVRD
jgi:hypothetical protein